MVTAFTFVSSRCADVYFVCWLPKSLQIIMDLCPQHPMCASQGGWYVPPTTTEYVHT